MRVAPHHCDQRHTAWLVADYTTTEIDQARHRNRARQMSRRLRRLGHKPRELDGEDAVVQHSGVPQDPGAAL
jgi:hypothetical protein